MEDDHIIEIFSAKDPLEANAVCSLLQGAGIRARVVGESVNQIAGSLPLNGISSPRVWVPERDKNEAANLIKRWMNEQEASDPDATIDDDCTSPEGSTEGEPSNKASDGAGTVSAVGKVLMCASGTLILVGGVLTWFAYTKAQECSAVTAADFFYFKAHATRNRVINDAIYRYHVNDRIYTGRIDDVLPGHSVPRHTVVHYDPHDPEQCVVGEMISPWQPLIYCGSAGALLMLVAYRLG
ncbi:MAG TPA: DUF2007 domain-containing protein [Pirellulales bacterium]|jgi:hypothetical protein|nr:DUF2007 domain-containing protein [Pirellulales bacterium]